MDLPQCEQETGKNEQKNVAIYGGVKFVSRIQASQLERKPRIRFKYLLKRQLIKNRLL